MSYKNFIGGFMAEHNTKTKKEGKKPPQKTLKEKRKEKKEKHSS